MASAVLVADSKNRVDNRAVRSSAQPATRRLLSLDVFRGLTIVAMILVNNPGTTVDADRFWPLRHAAWNNPTPTDLIFPTFLFIVGASLAYSLRKYLSVDGNSPAAQIEPAVYSRIAYRTFMLILLGVLLAVSAKFFNVLFGNSSSINFATLRLPGILQRIGLVYCATALVALYIRPRGQFILAATILLAYWVLLAWFPDPSQYGRENFSPEGNIARVVDRAIITDAHLYTQSTDEPTDPENLLGTLPAMVNAMFGYWAALLIQRRGASWNTVLWLMAWGAACILLAIAVNPLLPINKRIWTSSFVLLSGGVSIQGLALCLLVFDVWGYKRLGSPFVVAGVNAIFAFVATGLLDRALLRAGVGDISLRQWLYDTLFHSWIADPKLASLGFAMMMVAFWWLILWAMSRRGWALKV